MLSKVDSNTVSGKIKFEYTFGTGTNKAASTAYVEDGTAVTNNTSDAMPLSYSGVWKHTRNISPGSLYYSNDNWATYTKIAQLNNGNNSLSWNNITLAAGQTFKFYYHNDNWVNATTQRISCDITLSGNTTINKTIFTHKCLPRELKTIGNNALGTLFGMHIDNTRYTGENE